MCPVFIQYLKKNIRLYGVQHVISMANCFCQEFRLQHHKIDIILSLVLMC